LILRRSKREGGKSAVVQGLNTFSPRHTYVCRRCPSSSFWTSDSNSVPCLCGPVYQRLSLAMSLGETSENVLKMSFSLWSRKSNNWSVVVFYAPNGTLSLLPTQPPKVRVLLRTESLLRTWGRRYSWKLQYLRVAAGDELGGYWGNHHWEALRLTIPAISQCLGLLTSLISLVWLWKKRSHC
jgi:hypothetical protein